MLKRVARWSCAAAVVDGAFRNVRRSALIVPASPVAAARGKPSPVFKMLFLSNFADSGAECAKGAIWSSSPCTTRTRAVILSKSDRFDYLRYADIPGLIHFVDN